MLEFRILGPFEVVDGNRSLSLGGPRQRALLAILVLHAGETVTADRLIDQLWGEQPPPTAPKIVQGYVSHLRRSLGNGVLVTRNHGYRLEVAPDQIDAVRFARLTDDGRHALASGDALEAGEQFASALAMWRGDALADLSYEPFARVEVIRLEEARLAALECRLEAELALGAHRELIGELEALVRHYPSRERFLAQLMVALYRSGRQSEALDAFRRGRAALGDELGLEPGVEIRTLERQILEQDPSLDLAAATSRRRPSLSPSNAARRPRRSPAAWPVASGRWLLVIGGVLLLAAAAGAAVTELAAGHGNAVRVAPNSLAAIDVNSNRVTAAVSVGAQPGAIARGAGSLWVANISDQSVSRVDPTTLQTLRTIPVHQIPTGISAAHGEVWAVTSDSGGNYVTADRIDPSFDTVDRMVKVGNVDPGTDAAIAAGGGRVWVAPFAGHLTRLNPTTGAVVGRADPGASPSALAVGDDSTWLTDTEANDVVRVASTGLATSIPVGDEPMGIAVGDGGVWVADSGEDAVVRINPSTDAVTTTIPVGHAPLGVTVGDGSIWVANSGGDTVTRIDPSTDRVIATIAVGGSPQEIAVADQRAWVTIDRRPLPPTASGASGGTLRVDSAYDVDSLDPAIAYEPLSAQLLYATCVELVNYPDRPGPAASELVPEVARTMPRISDGGRTYTFTIRKGFRFAPPSNQAVTAQTFKDTIERTLNPITKTPVAAEFDDIVGASTYIVGRAKRITGVIVHGDSLIIRLTSPAPDFLARLAQPFFCPVPIGTPVSSSGVRVIPSAGPYTVQSYTPGQGIVLVRNPNYHGDRPHHFARIEVAVDVPGTTAVAAVEAGKADYAVDGEIDAGEAGSLAARYGRGSPAARAGDQQYFTSPESQLDFYALNTHRSLFSHQRLREAVNYAIDREALAKLGDMHAEVPDVPAGDYLPPGIPGHSDTRVYPLTPDLKRARRLARGYAGSTVVLYTCDRLNCSAAAEIIKQDLAAIGLRLVVKTFAVSALYSAYKVSDATFDMGFVWWSADYPDPDDFLNLLLETGSLLPTFRDPHVRAELAAASRLSGVDRYLTYGRLDQRIAGTAAPFVAVDNSLSHQLFSARIGCVIYQPYYGIDLDALCLRRKGRGSRGVTYR